MRRLLVPIALCALAGAAAAAPAVRQEGGLWLIDARSAPREALARELAQASGSRLHGTPLPVPGTRELTLRRRAATLDEAWAMVLGDRFSHARRCDARGCELWFAAAAAGGSVTATPQPALRVPQADPAGLFPSE